MIRLFCGHDAREAIGFHVFTSSVIEHASEPVALHPLASKGLPQGSNEFTFSRFLVPWLCKFEGRAIFVDACDMLMLEDIADLAKLHDDAFAVQCVQHSYKTRHAMKYVGTDMECPNRDYARKNWASVMLINCAHPAWQAMTPWVVTNRAQEPVKLLSFDWLLDGQIGKLPARWNRLVDEGHAVDDAAICHWTAGTPAFKHYESAPGAELWRAQRDKMLEAMA